MRSRSIALALFLAASACGPDEAEPLLMPPSPEHGAENPTGLLAVPAEGLQFASARWELQPGEEDGPCWHVNLRNSEAIDVVRMETANHPGLHHFNIFVSTLEREDGWQRCPSDIELFGGARPIVDGSGAPVDYRFPEGVAVRLEKNTLLIFQLHALNTTREKRPQQFVLNLHTKKGDHVLADIYGFTNLGLSIPPEQVSSHPKDCSIDAEMVLLSMSAHFHARGIEAKGELVRNGAVEPLYTTTNWDNPDVKTFDPGLIVGPGDVVRFTCTYDNQDKFTVTYGAGATDEMCFLFGYYYPKRGLVPCF